MNKDKGKNCASTTINWYPGHMAKTKREIKEKLSLIDVVYEMIDARMPLSSKIVDIDELIKDKPRLLIITKYDLCDKTETDKILKSYQAKGYIVITVDLIKNINVSKIIDETKKLGISINEERKKKGLKARNVRSLVIGIPNVGKSTLINRLVNKKAVEVGNRPGVTKNISWIRINKDIELLDSPGILWPKIDNPEHGYNLACFSSIKEEIVDMEDLAKYALNKLIELYPDNLMKRYGLSSIDKESIYEEIAKRRGLLAKGNMVDYDKVYYTIVKDLKDGNTGLVTFDRI